MERYGNLDLDLECDGGGVSQKAALFGGVFKRSSKSTEPSAQDCLLANGKLSKSNDSLSDNTKDKGVFKNVFKKTMKSTKEDQQQAPLSLQNPELSASSDSLESKSSKDKSSLLGGILKLPSRPGHVRRHSQDLLDFSDTDSLSENTNTKDSGGMFSGILKKTKKKAQSQEDLSAPSEISDNSNNLSVNSNTKETEGRFGGIFKKSPKTTGARAQSQEDLSAPDELSGRNDNLSENHTKSKLAGAMTKLNPFCPANKHEKQAGSDDEDPLVSSEKSSGNRQNAMVEAMSKLNPFRSANKKDTEGAETLTESEKKMEEKPKPVKSNMIQYERRERSAALLVPSRPTQGDTKGTSSHDKVKPRTEDNKDDKDMTSREKKRKSAETPAVPARPSEEELNRTARQKQNNNQQQSQSDDGDVKEKSATAKDSDNEKNPPEAKTTKEKKHKHLYPFIPRTAKDASDDEESSSKEETKAEESKEKTEAVQKTKKHSTFLSWFKDASDDEGLKDESASREKKKEEEGKEKEIQVTKPKKRHPLMPWVKDVSDDEESSSKKETKAEEGKEKTETKVKKPKKRKDASDDERLKEDEESSSREEKKEEEGKEKAETKEKKYKHLYPFIPPTAGKDASDDEKLKEGEESSSKEEMREEVSKEKTEAKVTKPKKRSPFMPRVKDASDDERLKENEESSSREEKKEEDGKEKTETKVKKPKKRNPFMPQVKAKVVQRRTQEEAEGNAETEGANRSLFDKLEDYRIEPAQSEDSEDVDLMEWWNTVEQWKDTPQNEDMTEKEEAKAFALTATKVQKGIRVFNKLFQERAESLWQHVIDLNAIADGLDKFNKNTKIAQITGGSTSAIGGIATVAGIALAPVTLGTSLIVTAVGLGVATAGGLTSAGAGISNQVNNSMDRKKVEKIVQDYQEKIADLDKCLKFIKQGIENLHRFDLIKMKNQAYNQDFPQLTSRFYEDGAMAGKAILINANEIMRFVQIANVAGSTAARAVQVASMATGVLTGLFVGMDIYFVAKDSKELKKGAKSEFAAKIREVAEQLHLGLVELNTIREELQSTSPENSTEGAAGHLDGEKKEEKENKTDEKEIKGDRKDEYDSSDEDEIDRIKKEIKKRYGNQEYV